MRILSIEIALAATDVGTTAKVKSRRYLRTREDQYVCHKASPLLGGGWINTQSGLIAPAELASRLNDAAQAAVRLAALNGMSAS